MITEYHPLKAPKTLQKKYDKNKMKKLILLLILSKSLHAQTLDDFRYSTRYMKQNVQCQELLMKKDTIIAKCDSSRIELTDKLGKSNTLNLIHESVEKGQAKKLAEKESLLEMEKKRKKAWRKVGIFGIIETIVIGLATYLTIVGK